MTNGILDSGQKIITDGLVLNLDAAQLRSYPTTGTTWSDLSGNNNNGTLVNGPTFNSGNGGSIVFDGVNDYVDLGNTFSFERTDSFTLSAWINVSNLNTYRSIINRMSSNGRGWYLAVDSIGASFILRNTAGNRIYVTTGQGTIIPNTWQQVTLTYNGNSNASGVNFYINSVLANKIVQENTLNATTIANTNTIIGFRPTFNDAIWVGLMSINSIYNRVLTPTEIQQNYNATKSRYGL